MARPPPKRTRQELVRLLAEQRAALAASCESFDAGNLWEAARLSTIVYTLLHDGGGITSLLTQLALRGSLRFVSSGRIDDDPKAMRISSPPLLFVRASQNGVEFVPRLDGSSVSSEQQSEKIQFERWWAKELIYRAGVHNTLSLTRRRLVFSMRHQDGGGHVGSLTDPAYVKFKGGGGWFGGSSGPPKELDMAAHATMRQIGWEVTETLKDLGEVT